MNQKSLPPRIVEITDGSVKWQRLENINYEMLGYFLSCHLIIEHYLDEYLKICQPSFNWNASKQTFSQKVALLSNFHIEKYDCIPAIKHMNSLRNKLSHKIEFKIEAKNLQPLRQFLTKLYDKKKETPTEPKDILEAFTNVTCALFAGCISAKAEAAELATKILTA